MLPIIAIITGCLVILTRLPLVIWPDKAREIFGRALDIRPLMSLIGLTMVGASALIAYAAMSETFSIEIVMWIIAGLMLVFGVLYVAVPQLPKQLWDKVAVPRSRGMLRALAGAGTLVGLFVLVLGLTWMLQEGDQAAPIRLPRITSTPAPTPGLEREVSKNSAQIAELRRSVDELRNDVEGLRKQFESERAPRVIER